jgi:hypothetical protein
MTSLEKRHFQPRRHQPDSTRVFSRAGVMFQLECLTQNFSRILTGIMTLVKLVPSLRQSPRRWPLNTTNLSRSIFCSRPLSVSQALLYDPTAFQNSCSLPATLIRCLTGYAIPGLCTGSANCYPLCHIQGLEFSLFKHNGTTSCFKSLLVLYIYPYDQY